MLLDERTEFADATSVGAPNNSTVNVGNIIDLGTARDVGQGQPLYLIITVDTLIESGGNAKVAFLMVSDSTSSIAINGDATKHIETDAIAVANLVAGYTMVIPLPAVNPAYERYLAFQVKETASQALTAGNVNAFLSFDNHGWKAYPEGNN